MILALGIKVSNTCGSGLVLPSDFLFGNLSSQKVQSSVLHGILHGLFCGYGGFWENIKERKKKEEAQNCFVVIFPLFLY